MVRRRKDRIEEVVVQCEVWVEVQSAPVRAAEVTFRSGPLLTPPAGVQVPPPAFNQGNWAWLEYDPSGGPALPRPLCRADSSARLPDAPPTLRDGWLRLTLGGQPTQLSYAVTPAALTGAVQRAIALFRQPARPWC